MRRLPPGNVRKAATAEERIRILSAFSNELCSMISEVEPEARQKELRKLASRFGENVALSEQTLRETLEKSFSEVAQFASIICINLKQSSFGRQIKTWNAKPVVTVQAAASPVNAAASVTDNTGSVATILSDAVPEGAPGSPVDDEEEREPAEEVANAEAILMAGIQDISNTLVEEFQLNDVLRIILETMYRAKGFRRVILCVRDPRSNSMVGRFGFGPEASEIAKKFNFSLVFSPDIFLAALTKGVDILITDTRDPKIAPRIPEWFRKSVNAGTFVIFPLSIKSKPVAMIYADMEQAGDIVIPEKELTLLRTLRNQAVLAVKQSS